MLSIPMPYSNFIIRNTRFRQFHFTTLCLCPLMGTYALMECVYGCLYVCVCVSVSIEIHVYGICIFWKWVDGFNKRDFSGEFFSVGFVHFVIFSPKNVAIFCLFYPNFTHISMTGLFFSFVTGCICNRWQGSFWWRFQSFNKKFWLKSEQRL